MSFRDCFQIQMTAANHTTSKFCNNTTGLLTLETVSNNDQLLKEAKVLRDMQTSVIALLESNYFVKKSLLCDVPQAIHEDRHDYGPPRIRSMDDLSD